MRYPRQRVINMVNVCLLSATVLVGCGNTTTPAGDESRSTPGGSSSSASPIAAVATTATTQSKGQPGRLYDVGGHKLWMSCTGHGSTTVIYVHGWVNNTNYTPHESAYPIRDLLAKDFRVCLYDRRNVGSSETVDAVQTPADMRRDMEKVLRAGHVKPPYILMAASFGGLVAYDYLNHHRNKVSGMVLIDTMFPDELGLDRYLDPEVRFIAYREDDACCTLERISQYDLIKGVQRYIGKEPSIPVVYLASEQEPRTQNDYESPAYDARVLKAQAASVRRYSPGKLIWVDAPHFMEPVVPDVIAQAVRRVDRLASRH